MRISGLSLVPVSVASVAVLFALSACGVKDASRFSSRTHRYWFCDDIQNLLKFITRFFLLLILFFLGILRSEALQEDWTAVANRARPSIVTVIARTSTGESRGTGFYFSRDGKIATNYHVIQGARVIFIRSHKGSTIRVHKIVAYDKRTDLAILQVSGRNFSFLPLADISEVKQGQAVCVIGTSLGVLEHSLTTGIVSGVRSVNGIRLIQLSAPVSPGNSGSPVLNRQGKVIGIVTFSATAGQNLNFAIPASYLRLLSTGRQIRLESGAGPTEKSRTETSSKEEIIVNTSEDFHRALRVAKEGSVIVLEPGDYYLDETIVINKSISITGAGIEKTHVVGRGNGSVFKLYTKNNLILSDLTLRYGGSDEANVLSASSGELRLTRCRIVGGRTRQSEYSRKAGNGLVVVDAASAFVRETAFEGNDGCGIFVASSGKVRVENSSFSENRNGVLAEGDSKIQIEFSSFVGNNSGVLVSGSCSVEVRRCMFRRNKFGIYCESMYSIIFAVRNEFIQNITGASIIGTSKSEFRENNFQSNTYGVYSLGFSRTTINDNIFESNNYGMLLGENRDNYIDYNSLSLRIRDNFIKNNKMGIFFNIYSSEDLEKFDEFLRLKDIEPISALGIFPYIEMLLKRSEDVASKLTNNVFSGNEVALSPFPIGHKMLLELIRAARERTSRE